VRGASIEAHDHGPLPLQRDRVLVRRRLAGALADPNAVTPVAHIFTAEQLAWFETADALPRYERTRRDARPVRHGPRS